MSIYGSIAISFVSFVSCGYYIRREFWNRKRESANVVSVYQKYLNVFSILTMVLSILVTVLIIPARVHYLCMFGRPAADLIWLAAKVTMTFYQISRLRYCFLDKQIHSKKYGYSNCLFYVLFTIGGFILFFGIVANLGFRYVNAKCILSWGPIYDLYVTFNTLLYYGWDWTILILYAVKICQIRRKRRDSTTHKQDLNDAIVIKRISIILHKIVFLTIVYEITALLTIVIATLFPTSKIIGGIVISLDCVVTIFAMYYMIENNHDQYEQMVKTLYKIKICCCFNCLMNHSIDYENDNMVASQTKLSSNKTDSKPTNTNSPENTIEQSEKSGELPSSLHAVKVSNEMTVTVS